MGGLFSSEEQPEVRHENASTIAYFANLERQRQRIYEEQQRLHEQIRWRNLLEQQERQTRRNTELVTARIANLQISQKTSFPPRKLQSDSELIENLLRNVDYDAICWVNFNFKVYQTETLDDYADDYMHVKRLFKKTNKPCFNISSIHKITNPYLLAQYELKKLEYRQKYGRYEEMEMFHGTKNENIDNICKNNFNWRLKGSARGHIFGQGVSFTPISHYATNYGDKTYEKVMIFSKVLVGKCCEGNPNMVIPYGDIDTSAKENQQVIVKYEDNTFYPAFLIYYEGIDPTKTNRGRRR